MFDPSVLTRRDLDPNTVFWNTTTAFAESQANKSFTYQIGVRWHMFSKKELAGAAITALAGLTSMVAVVALLLFILYTYVLKPNFSHTFSRRRSTNSRPLYSSFLPFTPRSSTFNSNDLEGQTLTSSSKNTFWKTQTSRILLCLFFSDLLQSISGVIQLHWIATGRIEDNAACKMQGAFLHLGDVATAIWSAGIAFLTFVNIVLKANPKDWMIVAFIIFGWTFAVILNIIGPIVYAVSEEWFIIAGGWCFTTSSFLLPRIFLHYVPMFLAAFIILISYSLVALHLRGILTHNEQGRFGWNWTWNRSNSSTSVTSPYAISMSWKVMWYPLAYLVLILPDSSNRLAALMGHSSPDWFWYTGMTMLFSMGWVNVLIYCTTRNVLGIKKSNRAKSVVVSKGGSTKMTTESSLVSHTPPTPLPPALTPTSPKKFFTKSANPSPGGPTALSNFEYQEMHDDPESPKETQHNFQSSSTPTGSSTPLLNLPPFGTWDEFKGTPFNNPFAASPTPAKPGLRSATSMIGPLTPLSQIGLAVTTPNGMRPDMPQTAYTSLSVNHPNKHLAPPSIPPSPSPSVPDSPSMYSCESGPYQPPLPSPSYSENPFDSEEDTVAPLRVVKAGNGRRRVTPSVPVSLHTVSETSSLHDYPIPSPKFPSSISTAAKDGRDPDRKMSLYPMSVRSTDTEFDFGKSELDSHYPSEGWIPIKL